MNQLDHDAALLTAHAKMVWFFYGFAAGVFAPLLWIVLTT